MPQKGTTESAPHVKNKASRNAPPSPHASHPVHCTLCIATPPIGLLLPCFSLSFTPTRSSRLGPIAPPVSRRKLFPKPRISLRLLGPRRHPSREAFGACKRGRARRPGERHRCVRTHGTAPEKSTCPNARVAMRARAARDASASRARSTAGAGRTRPARGGRAPPPYIAADQAGA